MGPSHDPAAARAPLTALLEVRTLDRGGMETVVALLAQGLPASGIEPVVVCTEAGGRCAEELRARGVRVEVLSGDDRAGQMAALLDRLPVGVLNAHYSTLGVRVAAERGIPAVVTLHNAYAWFGPGALDEIGAIDPYVSRYVAVSRSVAEFTARRFHVAPERIRVVRNGIAPRAGALAESAEEARSALVAELGLSADAELLVQIGRVERVKGQLALVDAMARLRDSHPRLVALIAGADGEPEYASTARARVAELGLDGRVRFLGERDDVARLLAAAALAVMPSLVEGLSLAAVETLQAGVPVVLTRTGDAADLLGEGAAGSPGTLPGALIDGPVADLASRDWQAVWEAAGVAHPPHAPALAGAIVAVLADLPARRAAAVRRGAELARELTAERMCRETAELLTEVALEGLVANRFALGAARERLAVERARNDVLHSSLEQLRALVADQGRQHADTLARVEHRASVAAATSERILDKLRIKHRVQAGVTAALGRFGGRPAAPAAGAIATGGAAAAAPAVPATATAPARGDGRGRERRWLVVAPRGTQPTAAARRAGRIALELTRAGERVTFASAALPQGTGLDGDPAAGRVELVAPGADPFTRWIDGRDESVRVLLASGHPADVEVAQRARERGARVVCDPSGIAADDLAAALATSDDVIASSPLALEAHGVSGARAVHLLPEGAPVAGPLIALASAPTVAVVVLCHNNADIIESCVESLVAQRGRLDYQVAIVDNSSTDGSWEWLEARGREGDVLVLRNERNGCSSGRNLGVRATRGEIVVFLDSDQRALGPGWLDPALAILRDHARIGAVAWNAGWFHRGSGGGTIVDDLPARGMSGPYAGACFRTDVAFLATSGFAAPRSVMARTAGFDEFYDPTCFEDTDISFQIKELGYELAYCPHLAIDHRPHATTGALREYSELYKRNEAYFLDKWRRRPEWFFDVR